MWERKQAAHAIRRVATLRAASHPDFHRRPWNSTRSTGSTQVSPPATSRVADYHRRFGITPTPEHVWNHSITNPEMRRPAARPPAQVRDLACESSAPTERTNMRIAVPAEVKNHEYRVAITPVGVAELVAHGHQVFIQAGAGLGSSISDAEFIAQGAQIVPTAAETWAIGEMVLKVKEPIASEFGFLRDDLLLFTYLHLAADRPGADALLNAGTTAIAYETVQLPNGLLPLLYPMSEVAGCLAPQVGAHSMMKAQGGRGVLMGCVGGVANAKIVVLGGGTAGQNAANVALGMGADVTILDTDLEKLRTTFWRYGNRVHGIVSSRLAIQEQVLAADMVIGTVLIPGAKAPKLVTNELVSQMKPGSVLVDVAIDQGGCFEDSRPTTHAEPTFTVHDSVFYCVANMPGAVPNTSTWALTNATLAYAVQLADKGWQRACVENPSLAMGLNTTAGQITYGAVAEAFGLGHTKLADVLA